MTGVRRGVDTCSPKPAALAHSESAGVRDARACLTLPPGTAGRTARSTEASVGGEVDTHGPQLGVRRAALRQGTGTRNVTLARSAFRGTCGQTRNGSLTGRSAHPAVLDVDGQIDACVGGRAPIRMGRVLAREVADPVVADLRSGLGGLAGVCACAAVIRIFPKHSLAPGGGGRVAISEPRDASQLALTDGARWLGMMGGADVITSAAVAHVGLEVDTCLSAHG